MFRLLMMSVLPVPGLAWPACDFFFEREPCRVLKLEDAAMMAAAAILKFSVVGEVHTEVIVFFAKELMYCSTTFFGQKPSLYVYFKELTRVHCS